MMTKSEDGGLDGYIDFTLSGMWDWSTNYNFIELNSSHLLILYSLFHTVFAVKDYNTSKPPESDITECRYRGYRTPPTDPNPYTLTSDYWNVLAAKLAFVVVFEVSLFQLY